MALPFASQHTESFPDALRQLGVSVLVSTYQAGRLIILRAGEDALNTHFCSLERPMGLAAAGGRVAVGTGFQLIEYYDVPAVGRKLPDGEAHDACYLPRQIQITGDIDIHEMAYASDGELWLVNTRMSCLCTRDPAYSIRPRWRPPFVSGYDLGDRCHLNGLALKNGQPAFVTALGRSDRPAGWRANKARGGLLMTVPEGRSIAEDLSMPHSPRWHRDRLWVLESGAGTLATVDPADGRRLVVAELPGFTRGLDFVGRYAFVGLSQVRETAVFAGLPLTERVSERHCGVWIVDTETGATVAFVVFTGSVQEIFAVQVLPHRHPGVLDLDDELLRTSYALPDDALADIAPPDPLAEARARAAEARRAGRAADAASELRAALESHPGDAALRYQLAEAYADLGAWPEVERELQQVLRDEPGNAEAHYLLGRCLTAACDWSGALAVFEAALSADRRFAAARVQRGELLLAEGRYAEGWDEWDWRRELPNAARFACPQPEWKGEPISDKVLLIDAGHGLDSAEVIQFARFLPLVAQRCARLIVACSEDLRRLLARVPGVAEARTPETIGLDRFDLFAPLANLPRWLGITLENLPREVPYLSPPKDPLPFEMAGSGGPRIGVCWSGPKESVAGDVLQLDAFAELLGLENVRFFSMQRGHSRAEAEWLEHHGVIDLEAELGSFVQAAAWAAQMDGVIGVDEPVIHLAAAMGKPVWVLLGPRAHWRWLRNRNHSPWYPTARLFRRSANEDWNAVIRRLKSEVAASLAA